MSKIYTRRTMAGIFILVCTAYFVYALANKPRILVLHSYATNYVWVQKVSEGVRSVLDSSPYIVHWHYMDTKRHPDPTFYARAGVTARRMIEEWKPRVIIAIDDHAQQYVASCYARSSETETAAQAAHTSECPDSAELSDTSIDIVYTGVNAEPDDYGYQSATNVTGLLQRLPLDLVKTALIETFLPDCNRSSRNPDQEGTEAVDDCSLDVFYLRDSSTTSAWREREIMAAAWGPEIRLTPRAVTTFAEWREEVLQAPEQFDLLLFSDYRKLRLPENRGLADGAAVVTWNRACSELPMVGLGSSYGETGEALGFSVAPFEQGEVAAKMTIDIIQNREPSGQRSSEGFVVYIRGDLKDDYSVPELYQAFAHATGTYYEGDSKVPECDRALRE